MAFGLIGFDHVPDYQDHPIKEKQNSLFLKYSFKETIYLSPFHQFLLETWPLHSKHYYMTVIFENRLLSHHYVVSCHLKKVLNLQNEHVLQGKVVIHVPSCIWLYCINLEKTGGLITNCIASLFYHTVSRKEIKRTQRCILFPSVRFFVFWGFLGGFSPIRLSLTLCPAKCTRQHELYNG